MEIIRLNCPSCHALDFNPETLPFHSIRVVFRLLSLVTFLSAALRLSKVVKLRFVVNH
jgi:hypothetical protein